MARLLDALMHPVSQIIVLIGVVGLSIFFIYRPIQLPTRPVAAQITPIAGGMRVPIAPSRATGPATVVDAPVTTPQPALPLDLTPPNAALPATAKPGVARRPLSAIPTLRNGPICACDSDSYSCRELGEQAQACFDYCVGRGQGDVHRLDFNQNGVVCEE